jgi:hypothetical protein
MGWTILRGGGGEGAGQEGQDAGGEKLSMEEARLLLGERGLPASEQQVCHVNLIRHLGNAQWTFFVMWECSLNLIEVMGNTDVCHNSLIHELITIHHKP